MRYILIFLLVLFFQQRTYSQSTDSVRNENKMDFCNHPNSKTPIEKSRPLKCKILRIKEIDKAYIIDINIREDTPYVRYTIISLKNESEKQNLQKIKKGKEYKFALFAYFPFILIGDPIYRSCIIYTIEGVPIIFKEDFKNGIIVTTPNLEGLYYIQPKDE